MVKTMVSGSDFPLNQSIEKNPISCWKTAPSNSSPDSRETGGSWLDAAEQGSETAGPWAQMIPNVLL